MQKSKNISNSNKSVPFSSCIDDDRVKIYLHFSRENAQTIRCVFTE